MHLQFFSVLKKKKDKWRKRYWKNKPLKNKKHEEEPIKAKQRRRKKNRVILKKSNMWHTAHCIQTHARAIFYYLQYIYGWDEPDEKKEVIHRFHRGLFFFCIYTRMLLLIIVIYLSGFMEIHKKKKKHK